MLLYVVRHGEAQPQQADPGLTENGKKNVQKIAEFLQGMGVLVESIEESGRKRASQTAAIMAAALTPGRMAARAGGLGPNDPVDPVAERLESEAADRMLVGHLPFLARLVSRLLLGREDPEIFLFQPAGTICLERGANLRWTMRWMIGPDMLST
ncbi:MAG: phosphohistidine phosphatase SixA [bacterium]